MDLAEDSAETDSPADLAEDSPGLITTTDASDLDPVADSAEMEGYIGSIPVRNLWLLMLYASDLFRQLESTGDRSVEENPDVLADLIAEILCREVERRLRRNLSFDYQSRHDTLRRVRGRIDLLYTQRHHLLDRGQVSCRFEELTLDTPRNRYVRAALEAIAPVVHEKDLARRCRLLAGAFRNLGVTGDRPGRGEASLDRFGRRDANDRKMVAAARLAFDLALLTEDSGTLRLPLPEREIDWVRRLFEKAVAGFYDVVLSGSGWKTRHGKWIHWPTEEKSSRMDAVLPSMQTDIVLDHEKECRRIVIDTKFNRVFVRSKYRSESIRLRSGYLYQMYAYLRSQEDRGDRLDSDAEGVLLHPSVGEMVNEWAIIQGHRLRFYTVDLGADAKTIRSQHLQLVQS